MNAITLLIAGKDRPATGHAVYERRNPISGELASTVRRGTVEDAIRAADAAAAAFPAWSSLGPASGARASTRRPTSWRAAPTSSPR